MEYDTNLNVIVPGILFDTDFDSDDEESHGLDNRPTSAYSSLHLSPGGDQNGCMRFGGSLKNNFCFPRAKKPKQSPIITVHFPESLLFDWLIKE